MAESLKNFQIYIILKYLSTITLTAIKKCQKTEIKWKKKAFKENNKKNCYVN